MCGKCEPMMAKAGCGSVALGGILLLLGVVAKLTPMAPMGMGPRSFAIGSALFLLLSIAIHSCLGCKHGEHKA